MSGGRKKQLAKNTAILTAGKICTQCVSFLLLPLYTAFLDPSDYGVVDLITTYVALILPILNLQIDMGLFRFLLDVRDDEKKQKQMISSVLNVNHIQFALFILLFCIAQFFFSSEYKIFLALEVVLNLYTATLMQTARGFGRNDIYSIGSFLSTALAVAFNVIFIAVFRLGALGMFLGLIISKIITIIYLIIHLKMWKHYSIRIYEKKQVKEVLKYSAPLVPNQLAWWTVGASDRLVVSHFLGLAWNGIYSIANKFSTVFITFYNIFNLAWTESSALHIDDEDSDEYLTSVVSSMFSLFSSICIGIVACMPFVFPIMVNKKYDDAYFQIPILLAAVLCQAVVGLISVVYTAKKKSMVLAKTTIWIAVINLVTDIALIKFIGLYAASVSTLLAYGVMMIYRYIDVQKYVRIKIPFRKVVSTLLLIAIVFSAYYIENKVLCVVALLITVIYAVIENRLFVKDGIDTVKDAVLSIKNRGKN